MKTTPIADMEKTSDIESLQNQRQMKVLLHSEKIRRLPSHPLHIKLGEGTKNRLKRNSLNHLTKDLRGPLEPILQPYHVPCESLSPNRWQNTQMEVETRVSIPGITGKKDQISAAQRAFALEYLEQEYPTDTWVHVYTDGSAVDATRNGGSGVFIQKPDQQTVSISLPVESTCTNFRAEVKAITTAANHLTISEEPPLNTVILTDSLSTLLALTANHADALVRELQDSLRRLCHRQRVILQWIPAHCGIPGNEKADGLARAGSNLDQPQVDLSYSENEDSTEEPVQNLLETQPWEL